MKKILTKIRKTNKTVQTFIKQTLKNYQSMKKKLNTIWASVLFITMTIGITSCNVTRIVSNESQYIQKGDTAITIQTKTTETYNAIKNK